MREVVWYYRLVSAMSLNWSSLEHKHTDISSSVASSPYSYQYVNLPTYRIVNRIQCMIQFNTIN